jgi:hypothetical protein
VHPHRQAGAAGQVQHVAHARAAPRRPSGRGWCAMSILLLTPGRRCASGCWP